MSSLLTKCCPFFLRRLYTRNANLKFEVETKKNILPSCNILFSSCNPNLLSSSEIRDQHANFALCVSRLVEVNLEDDFFILFFLIFLFPQTEAATPPAG